MPNPKHDGSPAPHKISETFLRFAEPILIHMPEDAAEAEIETVLRVPWTVWNAVVFDDVLGDDAYVTQIRDLYAHDAEAAVLTEQLIKYKRQRFGADMRLIGEYRVTRKAGDLNLWAEARDPHSALENKKKMPSKMKRLRP